MAGVRERVRRSGGRRNRLSALGMGLALLVGSASLGPAQTASPPDEAGWLDRTMLKLETMDFEFSRSRSDIPFMPVAALSLRSYGDTDFVNPAGDGESLSFRIRTAGAYAILPVHIGRKGFTVAVPYAGTSIFDIDGAGIEEDRISVLRLAVGGAFQTSKGTQWAGFVMPSAYEPLSDEGDWAYSTMGAVIGRQLMGKQTVWYYGLFYDQGFGDGYFLPYLGLTYISNPSWSFALLAPWPAVSYAPSDRFFLRLGANPSGASWSVRERSEDRQVISSLGGWDVGLWGNWRLGTSLWLAVGGGYSGLRSLSFQDDGDSDFGIDLDDQPFVSVSLSIRPQ